MTAMPVGMTPATVPPTASPSPTPSPTPPATLRSVRLPADTIALYGLGKEQSLDLYALGAAGSARGLDVQVDRGWLVSGDGRWAVHLDAPGAAARAIVIDNLEDERSYTIPLGEAGCMAELWTFDRAGTRLASVEIRLDAWALVVVDLQDGSNRRYELARPQGQPFAMLPGHPLGWAATGELVLDTFYPFSEGGYAGIWALTLPDGASSTSLADLGRHQLVPHGAYIFRPQLSPDGTRLLYLAREPGYTPEGYTLHGGFEDVMANQLWSLDVASGQAQKLVEVTDGGALAHAVAWSPDGREALFAQGRYIDGQRLTALTLQAVDAAGSARQIGALPAESQLMDLRWCRPDLALAILYHPGGAASELYTVDLAGGRMAFVGKGQQVCVLGILAARAGEEALPSPTLAASAGMSPLLSLHMVDERNGWALANWALLHTTDGGQHWTDVTPPSSSGVFSPVFLDANRAWAATSRAGNPVVTLCRTADGGRTWQTNTFAQTFSSTVMGLDLAAADLTSGWLVVIPLHGMNSSPAALFRTSDGGAHWTQVASTNDTLPYGGHIRCADSTTSWLSGVTENTQPLSLSVTRDGGQSWQAVELPLPPGYQDGRLSVGLPTFFAGQQDALLHAQYQPQSGQAAPACIIYASHDGGRSWQATTPVRNGGASDFFSASEGWIWAVEPHNTGSAAPVQGTLYHTRDGGQTWDALPGTPGLDAFLQHGGDVLQLDFVSAQAGWAIVRAADGRTTQLVATQDGGRHWGLVDAQMAR